jgi:hypothetical protein
MNKTPNTNDVLAPLNPIRVETALSRYPVHRLAKHGDIAIDIREKNENGEVSIKWEVNHVSKFGQPGPLAYKLDTLIINRRIEEASRPISRIIRLGSLNEICRELGQADSGKNTNHVKNALRQNAFAAIIAKIRYRLSDGSERLLEADFNRYSIVFTGEKLPNGRKADAVFIVLNDVFMQVINGAMTRPLDYEYLKSLPPASQRFYELLSYQMYAAIKNDRPRAKLLYSELCTYAPLMRQTNWNVIRPQLARIHAPHKESGYIVKIDFNETADGEGNPDWELLYQPGPKARAEYRAFAKRGGPVMLEVESFNADPLPLLAPVEPPTPLEAILIGHGVTASIVTELVRQHGESAVSVQVEHLEWQIEKKPGKIADPAAWLVSAIKTSHAAPRGFVSRAERQRREDAKQAKEQQAAADRRRRQEADAKERREKELIIGFWDGLSKEQHAEHEAAAIGQADAEALKLIEAGPMKKYGLTIIRHSYARKLLQSQGKLPPDEA